MSRPTPAAPKTTPSNRRDTERSALIQARKHRSQLAEMRRLSRLAGMDWNHEETTSSRISKLLIRESATSQGSRLSDRIRTALAQSDADRGGGWITTLYAAIDPSIRCSFLVAGRSRSISARPDQWEIKNSISMSFYRRDDCCFGEAQHKTGYAGLAYEPAMRAYEKKVQEALGTFRRFRLDIDESAPRHMIQRRRLGRWCVRWRRSLNT